MIDDATTILKQTDPPALHYGGAWQSPLATQRRAVLEPATGSELCSVPEAGPEDVARAAQAAADGFESWGCLEPMERGAALRALAAIIGERIDTLAELEMRITGRPIREMRAQMGRIPEWLDFYAGIASGLEAEANRVRGGFLTYTQYKPHGVCALLTPWNHPVLILVKKLSAALAAGNVVLIKPSELAPVSALVLADWAREAGLPPGTVNVVTGGAETGRAVCEHPAVQRIDLTGGTKTGREVAASAGKRLVPCTLELGGKTPVLIFEDVDLEEAVAGALFAAFVASGQTCVSGSRFLVARPIYDAFLERFARRGDALVVGDPAEPVTDVGSVISGTACERCLEHIDAARHEGAELIAGGGVPDRLPERCRNGFFIRPTIFAGVDPAMRLFREEVFGPVVAVTPFTDEEEALHLANDSVFGLGASIWTRDVARAHRVAEEVRAGVIWINDHHKNDPRSVWGGYGASGYGKENGWDALRSYLCKRSVVVRTTPRFEDWFAGSGRYG